jgi:hypothetical protein
VAARPRCGPAVKQIGLGQSRVLRFQPAHRPPLPVHAAQLTGASIYHLRLERVAAEWCLATWTTGGGSQAESDCHRVVPRIIAIRDPAVNLLLISTTPAMRCCERCRPGTREALELRCLHSPVSWAISITRENPIAPTCWCLFSASQSVTSHTLSGRLSSAASASDFRLSALLSGPHHCSVSNTSIGFPQLRTSVPFAVSTPSSRADGSRGRPVRSVPLCTRAVRANACSSHPRQWLTGSQFPQPANSKGEEIIYRVEDDWDWIWTRRLECVVDQHLDRAEDEQNQLQRDFELRQSKQASERKYDPATISYLSKQLDTAREFIWALRR